MPHSTASAARTAVTVLIVAFDGVQSLDLTGPLEVFTGANDYLAGHGGGGPAYQIAVATLGAKPVRTSSGLTIVPDTDLRAAPAAHTLVVPGGEGTRSAGSAGEELTGWVRQHAATARRITSVCTGSFLLARAGLLAGRRATTHWAYADVLARQFPEVTVDPEPIYLRDGAIVTSAGVTAGIDLALALVEEDVGREAALAVARELVVFLRRPGGQAQFSAQLRAQVAQRQPLREVQQWITERPGADLSVDRLAARAVMSTGFAWKPPGAGSRTPAKVSSRSPGAAATGRPRPCGARSSAPWASPRPATGKDSRPPPARQAGLQPPRKPRADRDLAL
jgi:transcriptional regulator GlxA family with amidase domain